MCPTLQQLKDSRLPPSCRLSHAEASCMDPQSRILLEQSHLALVHAAGRRGTAVPVHTGV